MQRMMLTVGALALGLTLGAAADPATAQVNAPTAKMSPSTPIVTQVKPITASPGTVMAHIKKDPLPAGTYLLSFSGHCPSTTSIGMSPQRVTVTRNGANISFTVPIVNYGQLNSSGQSTVMYVDGTVDRDGDHNRIYAQASSGPIGSEKPNIFTMNGPTDDYAQSASGSLAVYHCDVYPGPYSDTHDTASFTLTPVS